MVEASGVAGISAPGFTEAFEQRYPQAIFETLLQDKTSGRNIVWADNEYEALGPQYAADEEVTLTKITGTNSGIIKPRVAKARERQTLRTKNHAEVFTPSWLCEQMCEHLHQEWQAAHPNPNTKTWQAYVAAPMLEITCGEAPFICSRYDTVTGELLAVPKRIGLLDRKLAAVGANTKTYKTWAKWALVALQSVYGYEYQGDNLLIARINVLETFAEHAFERWGAWPTAAEIEKAAEVVAWNFWQMDGLSCTVPSSALGGLKEPPPAFVQLSLFGDADSTPAPPMLCHIMNWETEEEQVFANLRNKGQAMKKFYAVIGNPPYQEKLQGTSDRPIYNYFMDASFECGERVELITPARFLFDAGKTPSTWNKKMLSDPYLKVLYYEQDSSKVFSTADIKGGVVVTYRDETKEGDPILAFVPFDELRSILGKVAPVAGTIDDVIYLQNRFNLETLYKDYPSVKSEIGSGGRERRIVTNAFNRLPVFFDEQQSEDDVRIVGLEAGNRRKVKWINRKYVEDNGVLSTYTVLVPKSNGSGALGEVLSTPLIGEPLIGEPLIGFTQSFIGIGSFETEAEAQAAIKYIKSKFCRVLLGVLKVTQDNSQETWRFVPLQDFSSTSDIDWSQSISEVDRQLYAKYGLSEEEINFIETHVKAMA